MDKLVSVAALIFFVVFFAIIFTLLFAWPFMWLWNYAVVAAFTVVKPISYWTSVCLLLLFSLFLMPRHKSK